ncbi:hypothetical protein [Streptomyces sp. NPDC005017]|uniref:hypothetical protein n=1 Tax=Streptomyces sp. NPDC005017 TaxID=3364706 RepID=UPI0036A9D5CF
MSGSLYETHVTVRRDGSAESARRDGPEPVGLPGGAVLRAAARALSPAWKTMWLLNDAHAQGRDLYDAVLLAERHPCATSCRTRCPNCRASGPTRGGGTSRWTT